LKPSQEERLYLKKAQARKPGLSRLHWFSQSKKANLAINLLRFLCAHLLRTPASFFKQCLIVNRIQF